MCNIDNIDNIDHIDSLTPPPTRHHQAILTWHLLLASCGTETQLDKSGLELQRGFHVDQSWKVTLLDSVGGPRQREAPLPDCRTGLGVFGRCLVPLNSPPGTSCLTLPRILQVKGASFSPEARFLSSVTLAFSTCSTVTGPEIQFFFFFFFAHVDILVFFFFF